MIQSALRQPKNIVALFTLKNFLKYLANGEYSAVPLSHGQFSQKHSQKTLHSSLARAMGVIFGFNDFLIFYSQQTLSIYLLWHLPMPKTKLYKTTARYVWELKPT